MPWIGERHGDATAHVAGFGRGDDLATDHAELSWGAVKGAIRAILPDT